MKKKFWKVFSIVSFPLVIVLSIVIFYQIFISENINHTILISATLLDLLVSVLLILLVKKLFRKEV
jgi:uncharacterized membrane protein